MAVAAPAPVSHNPLVRLVGDLATERRIRGEFPPGLHTFDLGRTKQMAHDPLPVLLECYERFGPVFSLRILHGLVVFMLGPEANHYITVSHASNFRWRDSSFGDLIPLLGDGLLTIDGAYHKRARRIMLPAFHHGTVGRATATMTEETERALDAWRPGEIVDTYHWARVLAMRIAMRALLGLDPDEAGKGQTAAEHFERALSFFGTEYPLRLLRGPRSPWRKMRVSKRILDGILMDEIRRRRANGAERREDILGMLLAARDEDGSALSDGEVRDQAITLMFAGHDTSTSTITFLLHELARHPHELERIVAEQDDVLAGAPPAPEQLTGTALPRLEMALDETLRLYPPAWIGPRRAIEAFEFDGVRVPAGASVHYVSWASHRLPHVFPDPEAFLPERFAAERKAALPKGAYVPFGGGSRTCIGMRFGQLEVRAVATAVLQRFRLESLPGRTMTVRQMPTLSPDGGLRMRVRERD